MEQIFAGAAMAGLFGATATIFVQLLRQNAALRRVYAEEINSLRSENRRCTRRVDLLVTACRRGGIDVPPEVWDS